MGTVWGVSRGGGDLKKSFYLKIRHNNFQKTKGHIMCFKIFFTFLLVAASPFVVAQETQTVSGGGKTISDICGGVPATDAPAAQIQLCEEIGRLKTAIESETRPLIKRANVLEERYTENTATFLVDTQRHGRLSVHVTGDGYDEKKNLTNKSILSNFSVFPPEKAIV